MDLFLPTTLEFQKVAAEVHLPEDPNTWPTEILQELHKHIPYISDFDPRIVMDRVDAERGYALGHIEVMNKTEIQAQDPNTLEAAGINEIRIPIVVKDGKLQPFDLMVLPDSKICPLSEHRLRMGLFRPQMFDTTGRSPGDQSLVSTLYPPYRQAGGMMGGGMPTGGGAYVKEGAAKTSVLEAILPTIQRLDMDRFVDKLASDRTLDAAFSANVSSRPAFETLVKYEPVSPQKTASAINRVVRPDVAQLVYTPNGYVVKTASSFFWAPEKRAVDRGRAVEVFGEKIVLAADLHGSVTMADGAGVSEDEVSPEKSEVISQYGIYKCQGDDGREYVGFVFPNLIDVDGLSTGSMLFTNGAQVAVQAEIAGTRVGEGAALFEGRSPKGVGAFYRVQGETPECTIPFRIKGTISHEGEVGFQCETWDGRPVRVVVQSGVQCVTPTGDGTVVIPNDFRWMPLEQAETVSLVTGVQDMGKEAAADALMKSVVIRAGGHDSYSFSGPLVEKLASSDRDFLTYDEALFFLGGLGVKPEYAQTKLAQAVAFNAPISVRVGREVKTAEAEKRASLRAAEEFIAKLPELRRDLVKEASVLPDPTAVDTVLSIGFINPENVSTFISYLPQLDAGQQKMCELLLAARLGLKEIPTSALERAVKATEEVIEGLRVLAFQKN